jgi:uncharacterized membrane protein YeiH
MLHTAVRLTDFAAGALLAWAAAFRAGRHGLSLTGGVILGTLAALACPAVRAAALPGGMVSMPGPAFLFDPGYLAAGFAGACAGFALQRRSPEGSMLFPALEACSLGLSTGLGTALALLSGLPPAGGVISGFISGAAGGVLRDVCLGERPALLEAEFYGGAAAVGAMSAAALHALRVGFPAQIAVSAALVVILRLIGRRRAVRRGTDSEF